MMDQDMDCRQIEEDHVVERHLFQQLDVAEAERFEDHLLHCHACLDRFEQAEILARGLKRAAAEEAVRGAVAVGVAAAWWKRWQSWVPAAAVAVLAIALLPLLPARQAGDLEAARVNVPVVYLQAERGDNAAPSHQLRAPSEGDIVLVLELDPPYFLQYQASLEREGAVVWQGDGLELGERDSLTLSLPARLLIPSDYLLRLTGSRSSGEDAAVGLFRFSAIQ